MRPKKPNLMPSKILLAHLQFGYDNKDIFDCRGKWPRVKYKKRKETYSVKPFFYLLPLFSDGWFVYWSFLNLSSQGSLASCWFYSRFFVVVNRGRRSCHKGCFLHTPYSWLSVSSYIKSLNRLRRNEQNSIIWEY